MDDADLVVESFDEAERDFVLGTTVGGDAVPVALNQFGKLLVGLEPLPAQRFGQVIGGRGGRFRPTEACPTPARFRSGRRGTSARGQASDNP